MDVDVLLGIDFALNAVEFSIDELIDGGIGALCQLGGKVDHPFVNAFRLIPTGSNPAYFETVFVIGVFDGRYEHMMINALMQELLFGNNVATHVYLR